MTDIVQRLRDCKRSTVPFGMAIEAADEIERLRATNAELLTVLNKIANLRLSNSSAGSMARTAIDTMQALK